MSSKIFAESNIINLKVNDFLTFELNNPSSLDGTFEKANIVGTEQRIDIKLGFEGILSPGEIVNSYFQLGLLGTSYEHKRNELIIRDKLRYYITNRVITPVSLSKLDSPSSTSQITYKVYLKSASGANVRFGEATQQTIIAMEITG